VPLLDRCLDVDTVAVTLKLSIWTRMSKRSWLNRSLPCCVHQSLGRYFGFSQKNSYTLYLFVSFCQIIILNSTQDIWT